MECECMRFQATWSPLSYDSLTNRSKSTLVLEIWLDWPDCFLLRVLGLGKRSETKIFVYSKFKVDKNKTKTGGGNLATKYGEEGVQLGLVQNPENHVTTGTHWNYWKSTIYTSQLITN